MNIEPLPNSDIPDGEILYRYCRPEALPEGQSELPISLFTDGELSCDWEHFQKTPTESFQVKCGKTVIIKIEVCDEIRNPRNPRNFGNIEPAWKQQIIYAPVTNPTEIGGINMAHSLIKGKKKPAVQDLIRNHSSIYRIVESKKIEA